MNYHILHVIPYFVPAWGFGGPVNIAWNLAKAATAKGEKVTVLTTNASDGGSGDVTKSEEIIDGIKIIRLKNKFTSLTRYNIWSPTGIKRIMTSLAYDVVCFHDYRTLFNIPIYQHLKDSHIPYFLFSYGTLPLGSGWKKAAKLIFDTIWGKQLIQNASGLFAQTKNEYNQYLSFGAKQESIHILPLFVDTHDFLNIPSQREARKKLKLPRQKFIILFLGRIHEYKGLDLLVNAFKVVHQILPNTILLIVGRDDGYLTTLKQKINQFRLHQSVYIMPPLYSKDRISAYAAADLFALTPSFYEETSLASLEALACGRPVIVTKQADIPGLDRFDCGKVISYNKNELINAIAERANFQGELSYLDGKCRDFIQHNHSLDKVYKQFDMLIQNAL